MHSCSSCGTRVGTLLKLFVYGTLKRGCENHDMFCAGALSIEPATVEGKLFAHPAGYPLLIVPQKAILAVGTTGPLDDVTRQEEFCRRLPAARLESSTRAPRESVWERIRGELMTFDDPAVRLPALDELEDFHPGQASLYLRVLVAVQTSQSSCTPAWTYVAATSVQDFAPIPQNYWTC